MKKKGSWISGEMEYCESCGKIIEPKQKTNLDCIVEITSKNIHKPFKAIGGAIMTYGEVMYWIREAGKLLFTGYTRTPR